MYFEESRPVAISGYSFRTLIGKKRFKLIRRGKQYLINPGDVFGWRQAVTVKSNVIVMLESLGPTITFTLNKNSAERLLTRSRAKKISSEKLIKEVNTPAKKISSVYPVVICRVNPRKHPNLLYKNVFFYRGGRLLKNIDNLTSLTEAVIIGDKPVKSGKYALYLSKKMIDRMAAKKISLPYAVPAAFDLVSQNLFAEVNGILKQREEFTRHFGKNLAGKINALLLKDKAPLDRLESSKIIAKFLAGLKG